MKKLCKFLLAFLLTFISVSCLFNPPIDKRDNGKVIFSFKQIRNTISRSSSESDLTFSFTLTNSHTDYLYEGNFNIGDTISIDHLENGNYNVKVFATDGFTEYRANQDFVLNFSTLKKDEILNVSINVENFVVNGQIALDFSNVCFDYSPLFNVLVLDSNNKEIFNKTNISPNDFINNTYIIPSYFKQGDYMVNVAGGNVEVEHYIINNNKPITIEVGKVVTSNVSTKAFKTYYINQKNKVPDPKGTIDSPFTDINDALNLINNDSSTIIINGPYTFSSPVTFNSSNNIVLKGINNGSLNNLSSECIINNGASLVISDLELKSKTVPALVLNDGTLAIKGGVYLDYIKIQNKALEKSPINIIGSFESKSSKLLIELESYTLGKKIFNSSIFFAFDQTKFILKNPSYVINAAGECSKPLYAVKINIPASTTNIRYEVLINNIKNKSGELEDALKPIILNAKENDKIDITLVGKLNNAYYKWVKTYTVTSSINEITFDTNIAPYSGTLEIPVNEKISIDDFPLEFTFTDSKGNIYSEKVTNLPANIALLPETYLIDIKGKQISNDYNKKDPHNKVIITTGGTISYPIEVTHKGFIYVLEGSVNGNGSINNPIGSLQEALDICESGKSYNIILNSDITPSATINNDYQNIDFVIIGNKPSGPSLITCNDIFWNNNSANSNVTFQNVHINTSSTASSLINITNGEVTLDFNTTITGKSDTNTVIDVGQNCRLHLEDNPIVNGYISLDNSYIYLNNDLTSTKPYKIRTSSAISSPTSSLPILKSNYDFLIKNNHDKFSPEQEGCYIDENGELKFGNSLIEIDNFIKSETENIKDLTITVNTIDDILTLVNKLRSIPSPKKVNLTLKLCDDIRSLSSFQMNPYGDGIDSLNSLTIVSNTLDIILSETFSNFKTLTSLTLPSSISKIYENVFNNSNCSIMFSSESPIYWTREDNGDNIIEFTNGIDVRPEILKYSNTTLMRVFTPSELTTYLNNNNNQNNRVKLNLNGYVGSLSTSLSSYNGKLDIEIYNTNSLCDNLFKDCGEKINSVIIPKNVNTIGTQVFGNCKNVTVTIDSQNPIFKVSDLGIVSKNGTELYQLLYKDSLSTLTIPSLIRVIHPGAIEGFPEISSVTFEGPTNWVNGTTKSFIDFSNPSTNKATLLSSNDKYVYCFSDAQVLLDYMTNNNLTEFKAYLLINDSNIGFFDGKMKELFTNYKCKLHFDFSYSIDLKTLTASFMRDFYKLQSVVLPPNLEIISEYVFYNTAVQSIVIPSSVDTIGIQTILVQATEVKFDQTAEWTSSPSNMKLKVSPSTSSSDINGFFGEQSVQHFRKTKIL